MSTWVKATAAVALLIAAALGSALLADSQERSRGQGGGDAVAGTGGRDGYVPAVKGSRAVVWAFGDGADGLEGAREVAAMVERRPFDLVLYLGDVYDTGTAEEFETNYDAVFGSFAERTAPTIGNHEYANRETGYDPYWREVHGRTPPPWYSTSAAGWQILVLNSEVLPERAAPQLAWLRAKLRSTPGYGDCRIAVWHRPTYSAGLYHGDDDTTQPLFDAIAGRAQMALWGHDHNMQRLKPVGGVIPVISGAGGHSLYAIDREDPRLRFAEDAFYGAMRLQLRPGAGRFAFVDVERGVVDRGKLRCEPGR